MLCDNKDPVSTDLVINVSTRHLELILKTPVGYGGIWGIYEVVRKCMSHVRRGFS